MVYPTGPAAANLPSQMTKADVVANGTKTSSTTAAGGIYAYTDTNSYNMSLVIAPGSGVSQTNVPGGLLSGASELDMDVSAQWLLGSGFPKAGNFPGLVYQFPVAGVVGVGGTDHVIVTLNFTDSAISGSIGSISQDLAINNSSGNQSLAFTNNSLSGTVLLNNGNALPAGSFLQIQGTISFKAKNDESPSFSMLPEASMTAIPLLTGSVWENSSGGTFGTAGNWTNGIPNGSSSTAIFGGSITAPSTITIETLETVAGIAFNNSSNSYTLAQNPNGVAPSGSLNLDNAGGTDATINDQAGAHTIDVPITLSTNTTVSVANVGDSLTISSPINGAGQLTVAGQGTTLLNGNVTNTYTGGTVINTNSNATDSGAGSLQLGDGSTSGSLGSGTVTDNGMLTFDEPAATTFSNAISGSGGITEEDAELTLSGINSFTGPITVIGPSTLQLGSVNALGAGNVNLNNGIIDIRGALRVVHSVLDLNGFSPVLASLNGPGIVDNVSAGGDVNLTVGGVGSSTFTGVIQNTTGTVALTVTGTGSLTLSGVNTYNGPTTLSNATLILDNTSNSIAILQNTSSLTLGGGTLQLNAPTTGTPVFQNVNSTTFEPGLTNLTVTGQAIGVTTLDMNTITRNTGSNGLGAAVEFNGPFGSGISSFEVITSSIQPATLLAAGTPGEGVSGYATYGADDWAVQTEGFPSTYIVPGSSISGFYFSQGAGTLTPDENTDITGTGEITTTTGEVANSVRFNNPTGGLVNLGFNNRDQLLVNPKFINGGYLVTPNVGANDIIVSDLTQANDLATSVNTQDLAATSGVLTQDIVVWQNNTAGLLIFNTGIAVGSALTKVGPGTLVLNGNSTYGASTYIEGGTVEISSNAALGQTANADGVSYATILNGGTLVAQNTLSLSSPGNGGTTLGRTVSVGPYGATVAAVTGSTLTIPGNVIGDGPLLIGSPATIRTAEANTANSGMTYSTVTGNGTVILSGNSKAEYEGPISIAAGTLQIGNGSATNNFFLAFSANGIADNGNLVFDLGPSQTMVLPRAVSGTGGINLLNPNTTLDLENFNTYLSPTTITAGTLDVLTPGAIPNGGQVINDGTFLIDANTTAGNVSGTGTTTVDPGFNLGAVNFSQNALVDNGAVTITGTAQFTTFSGSGTLASMGSTSTITVANLVQGALVNNGTLVINSFGQFGPITGNGKLLLGTGAATPFVQLLNNSGPSVQDLLTINPGAKFDITNNSFTIDYADNGGTSPLALVKSEIASGYRSGTWTGTGIVSSDAAANSAYGIGYADGSMDTGTTVPAGELTMMYTLVGDANLDGTVNLTDLLALLNNYGQSGKDWSQGDFNYDGTVNLTDLLALLNNYGQSAVLGSASVNQDSTADVTAVPEPAVAVLGAVGGMLLVTRRRTPSFFQKSSQFAQ